MANFIKMKFCLLFIFMCSFSTSFAQKSKIDSLENALKNAKHDTVEVKILKELCWENRNSYPEKALEYGRKGLELAENLDDKKDISNLLIFVGVVYRNQGDHPRALEYYMKSLKIAEEIKDKERIGYSYHSIGDIYEKQGAYEQSIDYLKKALKMFEEIKDQKGIAYSLYTIGKVYNNEKDYPEALEYLFKSLEIREALKDTYAMANCLNYIGLVYYNQKQYGASLSYSFKGLNYFHKIDDFKGISTTLHTVAKNHFKLSQYDSSIYYSQKSIDIARTIKLKTAIKDSYENLANCYNATQKFNKAYECLTFFMAYKDSLFSEERNNQLSGIQFNYQQEKKEVEIKLLKEESQKKDLLKNFSVAGILLFAILALVLYRSNQDKKRNNLLLESQKKLIELKSEELEDKNSSITSSINYARRIQSAILPVKPKISKYLPEHFILFMPRDIVSGDFYWFANFQNSTGEQKNMIAAIDCTGHGVPGAMMSMVANGLLNQTVYEKKMCDPAKILDELQIGIRDALHQTENDSKDGMDMSLCVIDQKNKILEFAGAMNPLHYVQNNEFHTIKATRKSIGGTKIFDGEGFTKHSINLSTPTIFYMCSDGYEDQFGGKDNKKFMVKQLKDLLFAIHSLPMEKQRLILEDKINDWKGNYSQIDDILVVGVKIG
ncbi:MAG: hypothetical protein EAZ97_05160 [Bacteroidetes bacterium]|nr:MAG: hypothetical protein EAZ97_05160 [Bacteroidota bacterium]